MGWPREVRYPLGAILFVLALPTVFALGVWSDMRREKQA